MSASREAKLADYEKLLRKWNPTINLVSRATLQDLATRHIGDSLQLAELSRERAGDWLDLGSGGGLPGIVIAIAHPDRPVHLVDADRRKTTFLQSVIRELGLRNCRATAARIEELAPQGARNLSARGLAPLRDLVPFLDRHLARDGTAWLMKGRNWQAEVGAACIADRFHIAAHPSQTEPGAAILEVRTRDA